MKMTVNTEPKKNPITSPGMEVGLSSIHAWLSMKQVQATFGDSETDYFGVTFADGTMLVFVWSAQGGRVTINPPSKRHFG